MKQKLLVDLFSTHFYMAKDRPTWTSYKDKLHF